MDILVIVETTKSIFSYIQLKFNEILIRMSKVEEIRGTKRDKLYMYWASVCFKTTLEFASTDI